MIVQNRKQKRGKHYSTIGSVVRFLRTCLGLSQQNLADCCGGKLRAIDISRIERGDFSIKVYKILSVASFFGISLECLVQNDFKALEDALSNHNLSFPQHKTKRKKAQAKKDAAGDLGQTLVVGWEKERLHDSGLENLVCDFFADEASAGFDVFSFTQDGHPLYIEVKSSIGCGNMFFMTESERCFALFCLENNIPYRLYSIKNVFSRKKRSYQTYTAEEVLGFTFITHDYIVKEEILK